MIGDIAAVVGRVRRTGSDALGARAPWLVGAAAVVLLVATSGYLAATAGVTVAVAPGGDGQAAAAAAGPDGDRPAGVVGPGAAASVDADGDWIADEAEREIYGTDPREPDTDGDGIPDGMEVACTAAYPDADPLRKDVYVELDSAEGAGLGPASVRGIRAAFADAPVANPGSEDGIALHVIRSDRGLPERGSVNNEPRAGPYNDVGDYRAAHFQRSAAGYYYLLVVTDAAYHGEEHYAGAGRPGTAIVESYDRDRVMASLVLHELGHAFGIGPDRDGVDERAYSREEYRSVMNYNALYEVTTYSDGSGVLGRDEWAYVADGRFEPEIRTEAGALCPPVEGGERAVAEERG